MAAGSVALLAALYALISLTVHNASGTDVSTNFVDAVNSALVDSSLFVSGCIVKTCPALNRTFYCDFLKPNRVARDYISRYLQALRTCMTTGICGITLAPLSIEGVTLSVDNMPDGSSAKCQLAVGTSLTVTGIPATALSVTSDPTAVNQPTVDIKLTFSLNYNEATYNCVLNTPTTQPPPPQGFQGLILRVLVLIVDGLQWIFGLNNPPSPPNNREAILIIDDVTYNASATLKISFRNSTLDSITLLSTPTTSVSPISTSGSAPQPIQQAVQNYLQSYLISSAVSAAVFTDVTSFFDNVFNGLLSTCTPT